MDVKGLTFERAVSWNDVFELWRQSEEATHWSAYAREKGFASWAEWRQCYVDGLGLAELEWAIYRVDDPSRSIPDFHGGPFRSWIENYYGGVIAPSFAKLVTHEGIRAHEGVRKMMEDFPAATTIAAVVTPERIVVVEGMHRCCAIALAAAEGRPVTTNLRVALAKTDRMLSPVGQYKKEPTN